MQLDAHVPPGSAPRFAWARTAGGRVVGGALRTPPRRLLVSRMERAVADAIVARWVEHEPWLPGVNGPEPAAARAAAAWSSLTGATSERTRRETIYVLEQLAAPRSAPNGRARLAEAGELELMVRWMRAFSEEAGLDDHALAETTHLRIAQERLLVWEDPEPVAIAGCSPPVRRIVRVGPVYTPPEYRGRGYGTALVAALSRSLLDRGARHCMLYADAANPTANAIYQRIGYRAAATAAEYTFAQPVPGPPA